MLSDVGKVALVHDNKNAIQRKCLYAEEHKPYKRLAKLAKGKQTIQFFKVLMIPSNIFPSTKTT